jgi:hypothetical protein
MPALTAFACVICLFVASIPAAACGPCPGSRCALLGSYPGSRLPGQAVLGKCCRPAPPGWGWYLRQKLRSDTSPPLIIVDELGGVTLYRDR